MVQLLKGTCCSYRGQGFGSAMATQKKSYAIKITYLAFQDPSASASRW